MKTIRFTLALLAFTTLSAISYAQTLAPALTAYYGVKDALVATDAAKAKTEATTLASALAKVDAEKLSTTDKKALTTAKTNAMAISKTTDVDMQRKQFDDLSTSMITLVKATKPAKTYVQYCPMVDASWLSNTKEVRNPYYGDKMLKCGSVKEEL
ncbi:DUF3347 domain-containing protein [Spirosoma luteum]|jgi:hypothetical protein|uniref:DUF3347 domain-containing protein n=1 Tax=Spirosoma luteum TaxID=431553 RepID=UPI00037E2669|nr:DUF3347 domain-containing protein [Spirosoma luteum]